VLMYNNIFLLNILFFSFLLFS